MKSLIKKYEHEFLAGNRCVPLRRFANFVILRGGLSNEEFKYIENALYRNDTEELRNICNKYYLKNKYYNYLSSDAQTMIIDACLPENRKKRKIFIPGAPKLDAERRILNQLLRK